MSKNALARELAGRRRIIKQLEQRDEDRQWEEFDRTVPRLRRRREEADFWDVELRRLGVRSALADHEDELDARTNDMLEQLNEADAIEQLDESLSFWDGLLDKEN